MLYHLDLGVGSVVEKFKVEGLWENTLLFFLTDNGGAEGMQANNGILRGFKHSLYEGGIRTPFVVSWPAKFSGGRTIDAPVIALDIVPTVVHAMGTKGAGGPVFDGKSLLPLLTGESTAAHHPVLYWDDSTRWVVGEGNWKAVFYRESMETCELYDLADDPSEKTNLAGLRPELAWHQVLTKLHEAWLAEMPPKLRLAGKQKAANARYPAKTAQNTPPNMARSAAAANATFADRNFHDDSYERPTQAQTESLGAF